MQCLRRWSNPRNNALRSLSSTAFTKNLGPIKPDFAILENVDEVITNAQQRKSPLSASEIHRLKDLYAESRSSARQLSETKAEQNALTNLLKSSSLQAHDRSSLLSQAAALRDRVSDLTSKEKTLTEELHSLYALLPNSTHPSTPVGGYDACRPIRTSGPVPPASSSLPKAAQHKDHLAIATSLAWVDFDAGAKVTGSRWYFLINEAALLQIALENYAISICLKQGFNPTLTPDVIRTAISDRCGFQPRDGEASQSYYVSSDLNKMYDSRPELVLPGTAEIPLGGYFAGSTLTENELPIKMVGLGKAYRAEAGARGKESRGLYRVHQFSKVELFVVCKAEESDVILEELVALQEEILSGLQLPLRILEMSTEELGASAYKKYDIEAWMPGRGTWGELASASNCTDYQSRRLDIRYKPTVPPPKPLKRLDDLDIPIPPHLEATAVLTHGQPRKGKTHFAHTLNATAAAIPRLILALIENGAKFDAGGQVYVEVPRVLQKFWLGEADEKGVRDRKEGRYVIQWK